MSLGWKFWASEFTALLLFHHHRHHWQAKIKTILAPVLSISFGLRKSEPVFVENNV
jgi:hypothetical protein